MSGEPADTLCLVRGGGDLATGVVWRLTRAGFPVVVTELPRPLTVRRAVALSTAVLDGTVDVEGMIGDLVRSAAEAVEICTRGHVAVMVEPGLPDIGAGIVVDARMAKRNIDTSFDDAALVIGLGPGFTAGTDCDAVVETMRGPRLGRVLWSGRAQDDTGTAPATAGRGPERVIRAPASGNAHWRVSIGDVVDRGTVLGDVAGREISAPFVGVVRGLIHEAVTVHAGLKIGDLDPRVDTSCDEISDKALAIGGGVLEAALDRAHHRIRR